MAISLKGWKVPHEIFLALYEVMYDLSDSATADKLQ